MAKVKATITIKTEGDAGSGKTRLIDSIINQSIYLGSVQSVRRDYDKYTATVVIITDNETKTEGLI